VIPFAHHRTEEAIARPRLAFSNESLDSKRDGVAGGLRHTSYWRAADVRDGPLVSWIQLAEWSGYGDQSWGRFPRWSQPNIDMPGRT